jgi:hypothetical protein
MNRLFTALSTAFRGQKAPDIQATWAKRVNEALETHGECLHRLQISQKQLHATVQEHYEQLHKVRGKVYGGTHARSGSVSSIPFGDKDALRAAAGLTASTRFIHPKE